MGQDHPLELTLRELCGRAPIVVVARRAGDAPIVCASTEPVTRPCGTVEGLTFRVEIRPFRIVAALRCRRRAPLPREFGVVRAHARDDHEALREALEGVSTSRERSCYRPAGGVTLENAGDRPVVLFLAGPARDLPARADAPPTYSLYATNSLESAARRPEIEALLDVAFDDSEGPAA